MKRIGSIDDTNGEALCNIKLIKLTPETHKISQIQLEDYTTITTTVHRPGTSQVVKERKWRNFDTGEE